MSRCPFAIWRGPIANIKPGGMVHPVRGLVLHVEEGTETGTDGWFHNPAAQASAHFGIGKDGTLHQWVDTDDRAWAEAAGNPYWWSVETEGVHTEPMTAPQVATLARLYAWLATLPDRIPVQLAETIDGHGLGWHGMGGQQWGGHLDCPGDLRRAQRATALALIATPQPAPTPAPQPPSEEVDEDMLLIDYNGATYLLHAGKIVHVAGEADRAGLWTDGIKTWVVKSPEQWASLTAAYGPVVG